jgi:hypothetical protein
MYDDVGLKIAIEKGVRDSGQGWSALRELLFQGAYGPRPESSDLSLPQGAAEVGRQMKWWMK